jgi:uncharacterized protein YraI
MTKLTIAAAALAAVTLFASATSAFAVPGVTTGAVNLREGPSTGYDIIMSLPKGKFLEIDGCDGGFCAVEVYGEEGYVSASYLATIDEDDEDEDEDDDYDHDYYDDVDVEFEFEHGGVEFEIEF